MRARFSLELQSVEKFASKLDEEGVIAGLGCSGVNNRMRFWGCSVAPKELVKRSPRQARGLELTVGEVFWRAGH